MDNAWWESLRNVSVVVDNDSWILPYAERLCCLINEKKFNANLCKSYDAVLGGGVTFFLGCTKICPDEILNRNPLNLVVHESDLPDGKGFAPITWQVIEGKSKIPFCLLEAVSGADAGDIFLKDYIHLEGHELCDEIRHLQGEKTIEMCMKFLNSKVLPDRVKQVGEGSFYPRRGPKDSKLDLDSNLRDLFLLLRTVDNNNYPAFFEMEGYKYILKIEKDGNTHE